ncbi:MAG: hypothetical protein ACK56F_06400 [bacterium]
MPQVRRSFRPANSLTRAGFCAICKSSIRESKEEETCSPTDTHVEDGGHLMDGVSSGSLAVTWRIWV